MVMSVFSLVQRLDRAASNLSASEDNTVLSTIASHELSQDSTSLVIFEIIINFTQFS